MDIRQLNYFLEVARKKSITKAADSLHISQPALSKMIKGLEDEIGMPLFIRSNKLNEITDAGLVVMEFAKKMTTIMEEMKSTLNDMTNLLRGKIHIGIPPIIGSLFFPKVIAKFHHQFPNVEINITEYGGARVVKSVEEGEFELGVAVLPINEDEYDVYPIVEEEMKLLVPVNHPFSSRDSVQLLDLKEEEFIFYNEEFALYGMMRNEFIHAGFEPKILFKSSQWDFMTEMVAASLGVTILPESISQRAAHKEIKMVALDLPILWKLAVISKKGRYLSFAGRTFIDFILNEKQFFYDNQKL